MLASSSPRRRKRCACTSTDGTDIKTSSASGYLRFTCDAPSRSISRTTSLPTGGSNVGVPYKLAVAGELGPLDEAVAAHPAHELIAGCKNIGALGLRRPASPGRPRTRQP